MFLTLPIIILSFFAIKVNVIEETKSHIAVQVLKYKNNILITKKHRLYTKI